MCHFCFDFKPTRLKICLVHRRAVSKLKFESTAPWFSDVIGVFRYVMPCCKTHTLVEKCVKIKNGNSVLFKRCVL
jgi:hypothetical protein